jgi:hypothetical protein
VIKKGPTRQAAGMGLSCSNPGISMLTRLLICLRPFIIAEAWDHSPPFACSI